MNIFINNKLVTIAAALIIAGAVWYGFSNDSAPAALLGTENANDSVNPEDQDIVTTLLQLRSVTLSGTVFSSPVFLVLKDFSTEITQESVGRVDPFAPLPATASQSASPASGVNSSGGAGLFKKANP